MELRTLGRSGCAVSALTLGTMTFGHETDEAGSHAQLDSFVEAGERVGLLGLMAPRASRQIAEKIGETLVGDRWSLEDDLPPRAPVATLDEVVLISDFLSPVSEISAAVEAISGRGARGPGRYSTLGAARIGCG